VAVISFYPWQTKMLWMLSKVLTNFQIKIAGERLVSIRYS